MEKNGIMEWWKDGVLGMKSGWCPGLSLLCIPHVYK
jgi:hypothetical protein